MSGHWCMTGSVEHSRSRLKIASRSQKNTETIAVREQSRHSCGGRLYSYHIYPLGGGGMHWVSMLILQFSHFGGPSALQTPSSHGQHALTRALWPRIRRERTRNSPGACTYSTAWTRYLGALATVPVGPLVCDVSCLLLGRCTCHAPLPMASCASARQS
ncbi:hypothetical protein L227DRAFT_25463 [Lentinus tigrinus ALCF2SS1-6]|uniref:Uncharacterized protein n=1 Tax=Lentinus tigrinus ALCF2SS1-6 TaxID=1328759 RepID=A0A5C2SXW3_9APHY|nr:hypothetical protein L227DRAFT_25463 [Lentinus tigrinus ALCF2SS1-6]